MKKYTVELGSTCRPSAQEKRHVEQQEEEMWRHIDPCTCTCQDYIRTEVTRLEENRNLCWEKLGWKWVFVNTSKPEGIFALEICYFRNDAPLPSSSPQQMQMQLTQNLVNSFFSVIEENRVTGQKIQKQNCVELLPIRRERWLGILSARPRVAGDMCGFKPPAPRTTRRVTDHSCTSSWARAAPVTWVPSNIYLQLSGPSKFCSFSSADPGFQIESNFWLYTLPFVLPDIWGERTPDA